MKRASLQLKVTCALPYGWATAPPPHGRAIAPLLRGLLFFALVVAAGAHPRAQSFVNSGAERAPLGFVSASEPASQNHALTTSSGQRVARTTTKHDQLKLSLNQSKLAQSRFVLPQPSTRLRFVSCEFASYDSFRLSSDGGRGPPAAN
jgi:hypothetical protein